MRILTVNPGSSSLKISLLEPDDALHTRIELPTGGADRQAERVLAQVARLPRPDAVGVRFVHGGRDHTRPVLIDEEVTKRLYALADLAPLHQPQSLYALGEIRRALPGVPAVACFDTAFHADLPDAAATYALPVEWRERFGLRRYGFHGLSHAYATRRAAELLGAAPSGLRMVVCHLGSGASLAAVDGGRSVDTTMGFTPLDGLVMATRAGAIDPGIPLWLLAHGVPAREIGDVLEHRSGLRALAGTGDMRRLRARAASGDEAAEAALAVYHHRLRAAAAAMTAALGGLDALVFTGGVGEHDPDLRRRLVAGMAHLGAEIDPALNAAARGDALISPAGARVATIVVTAREDLEIAAGTRSALTGTAAP
ncbi:acetate/propionate family kinase [Actinomadura sp. NEAU-AAG7]|uniref:acetate/propionate family kinase n=1 Tax=Actinomadura sp. NEAU-AAG7 TaxID=2839640 RepID=UPI001BE4B874|nr:acetate/propionate family kinase [Actinomadura sp. NEAU-AAG7]MBT2212701.1 acetate/propionate family kinase [Actinomadura sp. NEAU-AAG7]